MIDQELTKAVEIVEQLNDWLDSDEVVASVRWTPYTLAILIGEDVIWEEQNPEFEMTLDKIKVEYLARMVVRISAMDQESRNALFDNIKSNFCIHCGGDVKPCHCMNDE